MTEKVLHIGSFVVLVAVLLQLSLPPCSARPEGHGEPELYSLTPVPFVNVNKDLKPWYFGSKADYFISTFATDAITARQVCQNLTTLTGTHFRLLMLESKEELNELQANLNSLNVSEIWIGGEKALNNEGEIALYWISEDGTMQRIEFSNLRDEAPQFRVKREISSSSTSSEEEETDIPNSLVTSIEHHPWLNVGRMDGQRCRIGKYEPEQCEPVKCNITTGDCTTITPDCVLQNYTDCSIERLPCSAECGNCTVVAPVCYAKPKPCTVETEECQIIRAPCEVITPPCVTTRPPCKTIQPPCEASTPIPCTTRTPCIPTFSKDNCSTVTDPCTTNSKNETVCPDPRTVCEPTYRCPPPEVCQSSPIICPPPLHYCEPETTVCPPATLNCRKPVIFCPEPVVDCPLPELICSDPQVICSSPVVTCSGTVVKCPPPQIMCPPPIVTCPDPIVTCTTPDPCKPPEPPLPPCNPETTPRPTTTQRPCPGCGCIFMEKQHAFKWDIAGCSQEKYFICEG